MGFKQAERRNGKLRVAIGGTSGTGKSYTAFWLASLLGEKFGVIDSERGSASLYALNAGEPQSSLDEILAGKGRYPFVVDELEDKSPQEYIAKIDEAAQAGLPVLVIDSGSHAWVTALEAVDQMGGWIKAGKHISPLVAKLTDKILNYPGHVIVTYRSKAEHVVERDDKTGKSTMRKVGLAPVARDQTDYEYTLWFDLDTAGMVTVAKTRCHHFQVGSVLPRQDVPKIAKALKAWLGEGAPVSARDAMAERIRFASDNEALEALVPLLGALSAEDRAALRPLYTARKAELQGAAQQ